MTNINIKIIVLAVCLGAVAGYCGNTVLRGMGIIDPSAEYITLIEKKDEEIAVLKELLARQKAADKEKARGEANMQESFEYMKNIKPTGKGHKIDLDRM